MPFGPTPTESQATEVVSLFQDGARYEDIRSRTGWCYSTIKKIVAARGLSREKARKASKTSQIDDTEAVKFKLQWDKLDSTVKGTISENYAKTRLSELGFDVWEPTCQEYSYMAMPWSLGKAKAAAIRADETGGEMARLTRLFDACFRIQREACEAAGRHIPMVVENVRGAIPWVGRSRWNYGSYHLWGDVPALMPAALNGRKNTEVGGGSWFAVGSPGQKSVGGNPDGRKVAGFRFDGSGRSFQSASVAETGVKGVGPTGGAHGMTRWTNPAEGRKGAGAGAEWFDQNLCQLSSASSQRKQASAMIAKIPLTLSQHIARTYAPS